MSHTHDLPMLTMDLQHTSEVRFTYASADESLLKRLFIRTVERATGQPVLRRHYTEWSRNRQKGENIFEAGLRLLNLPLRFDQQRFENIPRTGPLLVVANHPFGVADGLAISALLTRTRPDVKVLCHSLLCQPREATQYLLPVDFGKSREARRRSAETRKSAVDWMTAGHCLVIFPGGGVATRQLPRQGKALELPWHGFAGRLAAVAGAKVLPVFIEGENSTLFHMASQWSYALRLALLFRETMRRLGNPIRMEIGTVTEGKTLTDNVSREVATARMHAITMGMNPLHQPERLAFYQWPKRLGEP